MSGDETITDMIAAGVRQSPARRHEPAKRDAGLVDGYCVRCDLTVMAIGVIYEDDHPEAAKDSVGVVSEWNCPRCGRREGRWTGAVLTGGASEPLSGIEDDSKIEACQERFPSGSQPR